MELGKKVWAIGDGFMNATSNGNFDSHEAICVLNVSDTPANIELTIYFEDKEPLHPFHAVCEARRANHIRLDFLKNEYGEVVPHGVAYAVLVTSDVPIVAQHSRLDVTQPEMTLMTTIAY